MTTVTWAVINNFVGSSVTITNEKEFDVLRTEETDTRQGKLLGVSAEQQSMG